MAGALLAGGRSRFAFVAGEDSITSRDRERGFLTELRSHGVAEVRSEIGGYTYDGGFSAAKGLLARPDRPNALFCASEVMALGAMDAARHACGLRVPEDVSIFDLTTVRQAMDHIGGCRPRFPHAQH